MTRPDYQMISHRALWRLLHCDCEVRIGSHERAWVSLGDHVSSPSDNRRNRCGTTNGGERIEAIASCTSRTIKRWASRISG